jgi:polyisoprenyl-teichoic acid--peptidoglycan teichoic acid transferase
MRTTLKKGIGRGADLNGNGHAVLPPGVITQMTRYRQPKRSALRFVGRILFSLFAVALMVGLGVAGGYYLYLDTKVENLNTASPEVKVAQKQLDKVPPPDQPSTALVIGYDRRLEDIKNGNESRSDTLMLVRADPTTDTISMLSFPRDLHVEIHCPGRSTFGDRINQAYASCGPRGSLETVKHLTGLDVNYLIMVNFRGFKQLVANVGGVWMDVDRRYFNDNTDGGERYAAINLQPGYQKLNGQKTLDFARYRHLDNDLFRNARQQMFVRAFKQQITHSFLPTSVPKIIDAITDNVDIAAGGGSRIDLDTILRYAVFGYHLAPGHFFQSRIDQVTDYQGYGGAQELQTPQSEIDRAVQEFLAPDVEAADKATAVALGRKLKPKQRAGLRPSQVSLVALNGNGVNGSAANAGFLLSQKGYQWLVPANNAKANAPSFEYPRSRIYYRRSRPGAEQAANKVATLVGNADVQKMPAGKISRLAGEAMLAVVVGDTFAGTLTPAPIDRTPKKRRPPVVIRDPATSLPLVRQVRKKVDFPLMLPTVLERSSSPDPALPVRAYETDGHKTVRLTYRFFADGVYQYWGIQQTDWEDAPVLGEANATTTIGGRKYDLHYSGARLHMVVLRHKGTTYWVVNSLLDKLSNETMIAIAKGLRPLGSK